MKTTLEALGYHAFFQEAFARCAGEHLEPGRVVEAHLEKYTVRTAGGDCLADITGALRFSLEERADFPTTGDWVALQVFDGGYGIIHQLLPRQSALCRKAASHRSEKQIIGANIDTALVMQSVDKDFNLNRLDRYLATVHAGDITPVVLLSKSDLLCQEDVEALVEAVHERHPSQEVICSSGMAEGGLTAVRAFIEPGKTYCVLGSSGVGKSTLINGLLGREVLATRAISDWNQRGKHTTTHRALFVMSSGGILIDTPGMREMGLAEGGAGLEKTFEDIFALAENCRFSDCRHVDEPGCAVIAAIESGTLAADKLENFEKIKREAARFEASTAEKHKKARSQGKLYKRIQQEKYGRRH